METYAILTGSRQNQLANSLQDVWPSACSCISIPVITGGNNWGLVSPSSEFSPCVCILFLLVSGVEGTLEKQLNG